MLPYVKKTAKILKVQPKFFYFNSYDRFWEFLKKCDVGVAAFVNKPTSTVSYGGKIFSYMSVGLPVVVNEVGAWTDIVKKFDVGIVCKNNAESMADAILQLTEDPDRLGRCSRNAVDAIKNVFNYEVSAEKLYLIYEKLCARTEQE